MSRPIGPSPRSLYEDVYRSSNAYVELRDTLLKLRVGGCLSLPNSMTIERYSASEFDVRDTSKKLYARGEVDNVLAYVTSSDELDNVTDKLRRRLTPADVREDDVALARLLSEK